MARPLSGSRVAVTGGAQGIGRAIAERLVADGARVVIGDVQKDRAEQTAEEIGAGTVALPLDVVDAADFARFLDEAESTLGGLDVLVNNAGIMPIGPFLDESDHVTDRTIDIDLRGTVTGTKLAGRRFAARGDGHVVNIASVLGTLASPNAATYCATKFAVVGLGQSLRQEWRGTGVRISSVCPGFVRTELISGMSASKAMEKYLMVDPEDVAEAVTRVIAKDRSRTVFVPRAVGVSSRFSNNIPATLNDWMFRVSGGNKVTSDLDLAGRAAYQRRIEGLDR